MKSKFFQISASVLLATGIAGAVVNAPANAAVLCSTSNVSLGGVNSTACAGAFDGNDTGAGDPLKTKLNGGLFKDFVGTGVTWAQVAKSDEVNSLFDAAEGSTQGNWNLTKALTSKTFVVSFKASNSYSAYLFKDYDWSKGLTGIFNTIGVSVNGQGKAQALSHASLFVSDIKNAPDPQAVPEPATLLGLGLVASGMVISRRRQSR
ncbi:PEP-CTERM sorting domain-containing protein [Nostoc sp. CMAA1605]|uniref:PEP-CTERM sorting domain-containing protein n=1 Tax=Nostoc sp. CMAA1605 TaxID=2055159 RepID=UPI001F2A9885|nr:PEP-CTERM sorting domain-containing protein [Nostoc sp. CMAA1605]MCF4965964.1 PEP-CTERM sorting domain-containing protein [Nostoc sp. CMAA1605]